MAGFLALGNDQYIGTFTNGENDGVLQNGMFVTVNMATGVANLPAADANGDGEVWFVSNEDDNPWEFLIDTTAFTVKNGKNLRLHRPISGEVLVTTNFTGTINQGDTVAVGAGGNIVGVGARTPLVKFAVQAVTTHYNEPALELIVL